MVSAEEFKELVKKIFSPNALFAKPKMKSLNNSGKVFSFVATDIDYKWVMDCTGEVKMVEGEAPGKVTAKVIMDTSAWMDLFGGKATPIALATSGRMKVVGPTSEILALPVDELVATYKEVTGK